MMISHGRHVVRGVQPSVVRQGCCAFASNASGVFGGRGRGRGRPAAQIPQRRRPGGPVPAQPRPSVEDFDTNPFESMMPLQTLAPRRPQRDRRQAAQREPSKPAPPPTPVHHVVEIGQGQITLEELGQEAHLKRTDVIDAAAKLLDLEYAEPETLIEGDDAELLLLDLGVEVKRVQSRSALEKLEKTQKSQQNLASRSPVIAVMGHVDAGKTTLLDTLRHSDVAKHEAGGITQSVAAFTLPVNEKKNEWMTFIDTPGHEAFTSMREHGVAATDIIVAVISGAAGVQPQTVEVLNLARNHNCTVVVAMTKIDRMNEFEREKAKEHIQNQLLELGWVCEDYQGDVPVVGVSGITGEGLDSLKDTIALQAEMMDLQASQDGLAEAVVLESSLQKGHGPVVDVLVTWGRLRVGDFVVAGTQAGKVKLLLDATKRKHKNGYGPSSVARLVGLKGLPDSGCQLKAVKTEERARTIARLRAEAEAQEKIDAAEPISMPSPSSEEDDDEEKEVEPIKFPVVVKVESHGTMDAVEQLIHSIPSQKIVVQIARMGVGPVNMSDIDMAVTANNAPVFAFNVPVQGGDVNTQAKRTQINIRKHKVIYSMVDDLKELLEAQLQPVEEEIYEGRALVKKVFMITMKSGTKSPVAGCEVTNGKMYGKKCFRVIRDGEVVHTQRTGATLKFHQDVVEEIPFGGECGIGLDFKVLEGDEIECFSVVEKPQNLDPALD